MKRKLGFVFLSAVLFAFTIVFLSAKVGGMQGTTASSVWTATGKMGALRSLPTATLLMNGKVLVAGGYDGHGNILSSAELYDPATGLWAATGSMITGRQYHTATLLPNGKVLVAGGETNPSADAFRTELYDPTTGLWTETGSMTSAHTLHTATLLPNGKVLVAAGKVSTTYIDVAELYDPATGTWTTTGKLNSRRCAHTATLLPSGKVMVAGGADFLRFGTFSSAELYDPATGVWTATGSMNNARWLHAAVLLINGKVLVTGGRLNFNDSLVSTELYDPNSGTWTTTGMLSVPRCQHTASLTVDGRVLVTGGNTFNGSATPTAAAELYDPNSGVWTVTDPMTEPRVIHAATMLTNGKVLVVGGLNQSGALNSAELFTAPNPIDDTNFFVRQHYLDFLNREPDQSGFVFWTNEITSCGANQSCIESKRISVSASFFLSIEFQQTGYLIERMYKAAYGNATGASTLNGMHTLQVPVVRFSEFLPDTQRIGQGVIVGQGDWQTALENNKAAFALEFVQRSRFTTAFPATMTPAQFVDALNANAGGVLSASERATAINLFAGAGNTTNTTARAQAIRQIAEDTDLVSAEFNRAFVLMQYFGYLRRDPNATPDSDYAGYEFWLQKLNQFNGNFLDAEMVKAFLTSIEYRQRFGP